MTTPISESHGRYHEGYEDGKQTLALQLDSLLKSYFERARRASDPREGLRIRADALNAVERVIEEILK